MTEATSSSSRLEKWSRVKDALDKVVGLRPFVPAFLGALRPELGGPRVYTYRSLLEVIARRLAVCRT